MARRGPTENTVEAKEVNHLKDNEMGKARKMLTVAGHKELLSDLGKFSHEKSKLTIITSNELNGVNKYQISILFSKKYVRNRTMESNIY